MDTVGTRVAQEACERVLRGLRALESLQYACATRISRAARHMLYRFGGPFYRRLLAKYYEC